LHHFLINTHFLLLLTFFQLITITQTHFSLLTQLLNPPPLSGGVALNRNGRLGFRFSDHHRRRLQRCRASRLVPLSPNQKLLIINMYVVSIEEKNAVGKC